MIELSDGIYIAPEHVTVIKHIDDEQCLLFTVGQSALEGHVLPYSAADVAEAVNDYLDGDEGDAEDEDDDKDQEEG